MKRMIEKKFINEDLEIELTSFIDDKQNVWFKGKDVARILGYSDTKKAIKQHVSEENKIIQLIHPNRLGVGGGGGVKRPLNKMTPEGNIIHSSMNLAFMN